MSDAKLPILYDLVPRKGENLPYYSPHTLKARLSLAHKRVSFTTVEVTYNDTRGPLSERLGVTKATAPILELPSGELIMDSLKIAEYLERTYPDQPSLFFPGQTSPFDPASAEGKMAKAFLTLFLAGMGDSDSQWSPMYELAAKPLAEQMDSTGGADSVFVYFKSGDKQGSPGEFARIAALDHDALIVHAKASLSPIEATLKVTPWLAGDDCSFYDFILYGRYQMLASVDPKTADEVWKSWPQVADWLERLEERYAYAPEWQESLERLRKVRE